MFMFGGRDLHECSCLEGKTCMRSYDDDRGVAIFECVRLLPLECPFDSNYQCESRRCCNGACQCNGLRSCSSNSHCVGPFGPGISGRVRLIVNLRNQSEQPAQSTSMNPFPILVHANQIFVRVVSVKALLVVTAHASKISLPT